MEPLAVDVRTAASLTSLSTRTIRRMISRGKLRSVRVGHRVLVEMTALKTLVATADSGVRDLASCSTSETLPKK